MDDILDDVTGLVGICLVPESDESSGDVSDESYDDYEDKKSDEIAIVFRMAQNTIEISSDSSSSLSSDNSLETSSDNSSDSGKSQELTKLVTSSNKSSTFLAKQKSDNEETPLKQTH